MAQRENVSYKGHPREFMPADVPQQEWDRARQNERSSKAPFQNQVKVRNHGVHSLIEICNPNRSPRGEVTKRTEDQFPEDDNEKERMQCENIQMSKEVLGDLARLALVRKEREAAAQQRLAAKKAAAEAASNSDTSLRKISQKPSEDSPPEGQGQRSKHMGYQRKNRSSRKK